jgi:hypothetical protein
MSARHKREGECAIPGMRPDPNKGETIDGFQAVAMAANIMQQNGMILIRSIHKESTSGRGLIDSCVPRDSGN